MEIWNNWLCFKIWGLLSDHKNFGTLLNLKAVSTLIMVRKWSTLVSLLRSIWKWTLRDYFRDKNRNCIHHLIWEWTAFLLSFLECSKHILIFFTSLLREFLLPLEKLYCSSIFLSSIKFRLFFVKISKIFKVIDLSWKIDFWQKRLIKTKFSLHLSSQMKYHSTSFFYSILRYWRA